MQDGTTALESVAGRKGAAGDFEILSNETRLAILLALWDAYEPHRGDDAVSFSALRAAVGVRDSGQFNYHLKRLEGRFVDATAEGYRLRPVGLRLVQTVLAGSGEEAAMPPTEIDRDCPLCGAATAITYEAGWLSHVCTACEGALDLGDGQPDGVLFSEPFPPAALADRTPEEVFAAAVFQLLQVFVMKLAGVCPTCSGPIESTMAVCEDHDGGDGKRCPACERATDAVVRWRCPVCKYRGTISPSSSVVFQPPAVAFYHDHGVDLGYPTNDFERSKRVLDLMADADAEVVSTDPVRVAVTARCDGDERRMTLDERLHVVEQTAS